MQWKKSPVEKTYSNTNTHICKKAWTFGTFLLTYIDFLGILLQ